MKATITTIVHGLTCSAFLFALSFSRTTLAAPIYWSANGHYYEFVRTNITWPDARTAAASRTYAGTPGHLVTITNAAENEFVATNFYTGVSSEGAWIGGVAPADDGVWRWDVGPEANTQFAFWRTSTPPYNFANWGGEEPNHGHPNEDYLVFNIGLTFNGIATGQWWDAVPTPWLGDPVVGYLVEYEPRINRLDIFTAIELVFPTATNTTYQLQYVTEIGNTNWTNLGATILGTGATNSVFDSTRSSGRCFYRLLIVE